MDSELIRIQGIIGLLIELNDRMWKLKRDHGEDGYNRSIVYIEAEWAGYPAASIHLPNDPLPTNQARHLLPDVRC